MAEKFQLKGDFIELFKLLKLMGLCDSGGAAKQAVSENLVTVNEQIETRKAYKVRKGARVVFQNKTILVE